MCVRARVRACVYAGVIYSANRHEGGTLWTPMCVSNFKSQLEEQKWQKSF